jgi:hypothetical protein
MMNTSDIVIDELTKEIARLNKQVAINYALAVQKSLECDKLKRELEEKSNKEGDPVDNAFTESEPNHHSS